jgi:hypothetical protein
MVFPILLFIGLMGLLGESSISRILGGLACLAIPVYALLLYLIYRENGI